MVVITTPGAVRAAVAVAARNGLTGTDPAVLKDGSNVVVHLRPFPLVARVATTTALVRDGVWRWFARDLAVARYLVDAGIPAVAPSTDPPAGPHHHDGYTLTLWPHLPHDPATAVRPSAAAALLADLHAALLHYPGELPRRGPQEDIANTLDVVAPTGLLDGSDLARLRAEAAALEGRLGTLAVRPLHGDAHPANLLCTPRGPVWNDFEDTWRGPLGWDLACMLGSPRIDGRAMLAAYPAEVPAEELAVCVRLRRLQAVAWTFLLATRFPGRVAQAEQTLAAWSRP